MASSKDSLRAVSSAIAAPGRRNILKASLAAMAAPLLGHAGSVYAQQENWPTRAVRVVVPFSAGGAADTSARTVGAKVAEILGQTLVIENRTGGNAVVAALAVLQAPKDGYTLIWDAANQLTNQLLIKNLKFDYEQSFTPITMAVRVPQVIAVRQDFPAKNLKEFVDYVKAHPNSVSCGTPPSGAMAHLALMRFQELSGTKLIHTPYRGGADAGRDLMGGQIDSALITLSTARGGLESGKTRILAVTSLERSPQYPDIPTIAEQGYAGYDMDDWFGFFAPEGTPANVITRVQEATAQAAKDPELIKAIAPSAAVLVANTPQEFSSWLDQQRKLLAKLIKDANISIG
jgi:tripartite-type tricarboxylate transporter receptor subunit TctC